MSHPSEPLSAESPYSCGPACSAAGRVIGGYPIHEFTKRLAGELSA
jgi:hypothetical protein